MICMINPFFFPQVFYAKLDSLCTVLIYVMQASSGASALRYDEVNDDRNEDPSDQEEGSRRGFEEEGDDNADQSENDQELEDDPEISDYDALRLRNIARNKETLVNLGLTKPEAPPKVPNVFCDH